jgi:formylglycine-generating enzyme required for sulfatase activity
MLPEAYRWILEQFEPEGDPWLLFAIAQELEQAGQREDAASVYDRAFAIDPSLEPIREARARLLSDLAVVEHGIRFCYIPAGPFLMGSRQGEPDELPVHPVWLSAYWLAETPISWAMYCRLLGWLPPPEGRPSNTDELPHIPRFKLYNTSKIRLQYCEDHTTRAVDWHAHLPDQTSSNPPPRSQPDAPWTYEQKPMIAVGWQDAEELAKMLSTSSVRYRLPSEAQWEKAARGGRIGALYPWGDEPPTAERCDFGRFTEFAIQPMKSFAPNDYDLYAMSGTIWEWTSDWNMCLSGAPTPVGRELGSG